jgi:hypothetical protein
MNEVHTGGVAWLFICVSRDSRCLEMLAKEAGWLNRQRTKCSNKIMDTKNPVIQFCMQGNQAEFEGRIDEARTLFWQAWEAARDDYEACIAAHYVARHQKSPQEALRWNLEALTRAEAVGDERVQSFYPSLYVNLGHSYEMCGDQAEARRYYEMAADLGLFHQADE